VNIHEYQARAILERYGIPVPRGDVAETPASARVIAERFGVPVVVKAQVLVGGRGKAGGVKLASNGVEAEEVARRILGMNIKGNIVGKVLVAEATNIEKEMYLGFVMDRASKRIVAMASAEGGVDIEEVARTSPEKIIKLAADPHLGFLDYHGRELAFAIGVPSPLVRDFAKIAKALYALFVENDASLAEINPLVIGDDGQLHAIDAKIVVDDNALFRHCDLEELRDAAAEDPFERRAREQGISYVKLDGEIGCMVNGAGLAMATMDVIKLYGGSPANFLDVGGGARADTVAAALDIILSDSNVKAVLFNIFGGITRCDEVAKGIVASLGKQRQVPIVVRLVGTNEEEGRRILSAANIVAVATMTDAAKQVVQALRGAKGGVI
jgi:succinyl-CoA synthetase beta subunit